MPDTWETPFPLPSPVAGEIKNHFRGHGWAVKLHRSLQHQRRFVGQEVDTFTQRLAISPTPMSGLQRNGASRQRLSPPERVPR